METSASAHNNADSDARSLLSPAQAVQFRNPSASLCIEDLDFSMRLPR